MSNGNSIWDFTFNLQMVNSKKKKNGRTRLQIRYEDYEDINQQQYLNLHHHNTISKS